MGARKGNPRRQYGCPHAGVPHRLPTQRAIPPGPNPNVTRREIVIEADVATLEKVRKEGHARVRDNVYTMYPVSSTAAHNGSGLDLNA
jgi:hypothetical protein